MAGGDVQKISNALPPENQESGRKRIYNGTIGLIVDKTEEKRKELEQLTLDTGGYVESSYTDYMILRIPAAAFRETFNRILEMGTVTQQEISTLDVTDQYADSQQRLETVRKTRERLYDLLEKSSDPEERSKILREIGRLSEEIESLNQQLILMENRIAFSRITVHLEPRLSDYISRSTIPFEWIATLDPLSPVSGKLKAKLKIDPGTGFAVFDREKYFAAENADGTTLFLSTLENNPRGDSGFWQQALSFHLSSYYEEAVPLTIALGDSEFQGLRFTSKDRTPYAYTVAVLTEGKKLHVLEIFSPDASADLSLLMKALNEGEIR